MKKPCGDYELFRLDCGKDIPENLNFSPAPGNKKDMKYMERINEYKQRRHIEL